MYLWMISQGACAAGLMAAGWLLVKVYVRSSELDSKCGLPNATFYQWSGSRC